MKNYLSLWDDEEGVTPGPLPDDVVSILVVRLFEDIRDLDQSVFGQVLEDWYAVNKQ